MDPPICLRRSSGYRLQLDVLNDEDSSDSFTFVVMADPQPGLLERYIEKRSEPYHWDRDLHCVDRAVAIINQLSPKPVFVIACGDLVDGQPGHKYRVDQTADLFGSLAALDPSIALLALPGNHDVGDRPGPFDLADYRNTWGDDYYSFRVYETEFLVLNSQLMWDDSNCKQEGERFRNWLQTELDRLRENRSKTKIAFQHIPFFVNEPSEGDAYYNIPQKTRSDQLHALYNAGIRYVFTGHLHRNVCHTWIPADVDSNASPLYLVSSSSLCVQLGQDQPGLRLVHVSSKHGVRHIYYSFDELEYTLHRREQPQFPN